MQDFLSLPSPTFCCLDAVITVPNQVDGRGKAQSGFHSSKKKKERKKRKKMARAHQLEHRRHPFS
jgi:hypothetical protein